MANPFAPAQVDFSMLANLPNIYEQGQEIGRQRDLRNAFSGGLPMGPNGEVDFNSMSQMFAQGGDPRTAASLAQTQANTRLRNAPKPPTQYQQQQIDFRREEIDRKKAEKQEAEKNQKGVLVSEMARLKETAKELKAHKGLAGSVGGYEVMGYETPIPAASLMTKAGSDEADFEAKFENLKSQVGFNVLQAMRQASKTGGALGSIAVAELTMLQNNLAALDPKQGDAQFKDELDKIMTYADDVIGRLNAVETGGGSDFQEGQTATNPQTGQKIMFRGGQWVPAQ